MKFISQFGTDYGVSGQEEGEEGDRERDTLCWKILEGGIEDLHLQKEGGAPVLWVQLAAVNYLRSLRWPMNLPMEKKLSKVFYLISTINILNWTRLKTGESSDGKFVPLSSVLLQEVMGHEYAKIMKFLKLVGFIEVFTRKGRESYSTGGDGRKGACKKYRISQAYLKGPFIPIFITGPLAFPRRIVEAIEEARTRPLDSPVQELIRRNTLRLKFEDPEEVVKVLEGLGKSEEGVQSQMYNLRFLSQQSSVAEENCSRFHTDFYGRVYSSFSNLFREARPYLRLDSESLVCLDLHASHWFHALMLWGDRDCEDFGVLSEELTKGDFYQVLSDRIGLDSRDASKLPSLKYLHSHPYGMANEARSISKALEEVAPSFAKWIRGEKLRQQIGGFKAFSWRLLREESNRIIVDSVGELMKLDPDYPVITLHDALYVPEGHQGEALGVLETVYETAYGIIPKIGIESPEEKIVDFVDPYQFGIEEEAETDAA